MVATDVKQLRQGATKSRILYFSAALSALFVVFVFFGIFAALIHGSSPAFHAFGFHFLFSHAWDPMNSNFGGAGAVQGTLISSIIALVIAIPVSFGITVFTLKIAPYWSRHYIRISIDLLAGIPSLVYGMWGLFFLVPLIGTYMQPWFMHHFGSLPYIGDLFSGPPLGVGLFTGGLVLSIMVIPFISSIMYDVFELVPDLLQESAYALGATTHETIWKVIVPYGRSGFIGGIMLGLGRALGETMAVAFVIGNAHTLTTTLFAPASSITASLANEFTEATTDLYTSALVELGLYLFVITTIVIFTSRLLLRLVSKRNQQVAET